jgi:hypothetical protein
LVSVLILLSTPLPCRAVIGDEHWDVAFGVAGTSNFVNAIRWHQGKLYTGGAPNSPSFTNTTLNIWDGQQWSSLGRFVGSSVSVLDLMFVGDTLYAAGNFASVDGVAISGLASWNGTAWSSVGGFKGIVEQLAFDGINLYVAGQFTNTVGVTGMTNIAYWDGSAWHALGNGLGRNGDLVFSVISTNGGVYAGGSFTNSGPLLLTNLAFWNGSSWAEVGPPLNLPVQSLAVNGTDLYASGLFTLAGANSASHIAKWNGTWSALGSGLNAGAIKLTWAGNQLYAAGAFTNAGGISASRFAVWNGTSWSSAGTGLSSTGSALLTTESNLYVGGQFAVAGGGLALHLAIWDGNVWSGIGLPGRTNATSGAISSAVRAFATDGTNLYVGGLFAAAGGLPATNIALWDGTQWHAVGPGLNGTVNSLVMSGSNLYAGGTFTAAGNTAVSRVARWDGFSWYPLGSGIPSNVNAVATYGSDILAGGNFKFNVSDGPATCITRWDGTNWWMFGGYSLSAPTTGTGIDAIAVHGSDVYVGGNFVASGYYGQVSTNVVRYDTFDWVSLGGGVNSNVNSLIFIGNDLYAGGQFTSAGGIPASRIAMWNGAQWSPLGNGLSGTGGFAAASLVSVGNVLYVGGTFTNASGSGARGVAEWNGANWYALGSGISATPIASSSNVFAVVTTSSGLYVGGSFGSAGGKDSVDIAHWNDAVIFDAFPALQISNPHKPALAPFSFNINATAVPSYIIEASTNLSSWTPLATNSATSLQFYDSNSQAFPFRLYRVHAGP